MLGTLGLIALEIMAYLVLVKRFPILGAQTSKVAKALGGSTHV
jgi:Ni/Fe-hydrogenase subunit HybB-like protein